MRKGLTEEVWGGLDENMRFKWTAALLVMSLILGYVVPKTGHDLVDNILRSYVAFNTLFLIQVQRKLTAYSSSNFAKQLLRTSSVLALIGLVGAPCLYFLGPLFGIGKGLLDVLLMLLKSDSSLPLPIKLGVWIASAVGAVLAFYQAFVQLEIRRAVFVLPHQLVRRYLLGRRHPARSLGELWMLEATMMFSSFGVAAVIAALVSAYVPLLR